MRLIYFRLNILCIQHIIASTYLKKYNKRDNIACQTLIYRIYYFLQYYFHDMIFICS